MRDPDTLVALAIVAAAVLVIAGCVALRAALH